MATDTDIEMATRGGDPTYSEPNPDPYESELEYIDDVHDYTTLGEDPCQVGVKVTFAVARQK